MKPRKQRMIDHAAQENHNIDQNGRYKNKTMNWDQRRGLMLLAAGFVVLVIGTVLAAIFGDGSMATKITKTVMKVIEAVLFFIYFYLCRSELLTKKYLTVIVGYLLYTAGDVVLNYNLYIGMLLFAAGHVFFTLMFITTFRPKKYQMIVDIALIVLTIVGVIVLNVKFWPIGLAAIIYSVFVSSMFASSLGINRIMPLGTVLFIISDILIALRTVLFPGSLLLAILISVTYYGAIVIMLNALKARHFVRAKQRI